MHCGSTLKEVFSNIILLFHFYY